MKQNKEFFNWLNNNIISAKSVKTLEFLKKKAKDYVDNLPSSTDKRILLDARRKLKKSFKLISRKITQFK